MARLFQTWFLDVKNYIFTKENMGFSTNKTLMNSPTLCWPFKTHAISGNQPWGSSSNGGLVFRRRLILLLTLSVTKQLLLDTFGTCNFTIK